ncbi:hypothetical protein RE9416_41290 [Prescottella equi]|nr:hypothetical protein RE9416_41290 [Prescottella equi]
MVDLGVDGEAAVREAFDQMHFPQRAVAVEQAAVQARDEGGQFLHPAGVRERVVPDVMADVELVVVGPEPLSE